MQSFLPELQFLLSQRLHMFHASRNSDVISCFHFFKMHISYRGTLYISGYISSSCFIEVLAEQCRFSICCFKLSFRPDLNPQIGQAKGVALIKITIYFRIFTKSRTQVNMLWTTVFLQGKFTFKCDSICRSKWFFLFVL